MTTKLGTHRDTVSQRPVPPQSILEHGRHTPCRVRVHLSIPKVLSGQSWASVPNPSSAPRACGMNARFGELSRTCHPSAPWPMFHPSLSETGDISSCSFILASFLIRVDNLAYRDITSTSTTTDGAARTSTEATAKSDPGVPRCGSSAAQEPVNADGRVLRWVLRAMWSQVVEAIPRLGGLFGIRQKSVISTTIF